MTSVDALRIAAELTASSNALAHKPGAGPGQVGLLQAAAQFTVAAAIFDLAAAVRELAGRAPA